MNRFFQILDCNKVLGTCCTDYGLLHILDIIRRALDLIQLMVPILLMVALVIQFTQLLVNPDDDKKKKSLINKFKAAFICFFVPFLVNLALGVLPDDMETFQLGACWDSARISREVLKEQNSTYVSTTNKKPSTFIITNFPDIQGGGSSGEGSTTGRAIVAYAKEFVGQPYSYGGSWNGERPYTPTDCSGFVQGVFSHFGISLPRSSSAQWAATNTYTLVTDGNIKAGDVVMYNGHVGILTGNGKEMVHASNAREGIKISESYDYRTVLGIMRINGVN